MRRSHRLARVKAGRTLPRAMISLQAALLIGLNLASSCGRRIERVPADTAPLVVRTEHLRARLISQDAALHPGGRELVAVLFEIDPGWHVYGPSRSDSGLPLVIQPVAPAGYRFEGPLWPTPRRHVADGEILDHVYEGEVAVLLPLQVPADARPGETVTLRCRVEWLVCGTGCLPGEGDLSLSLPIANTAAARQASADSPRIRESWERVPVGQDLLEPGASLRWGLDAWEARVPGATALAFYPDPSCAALLNPLADAAASADHLRLRLLPGDPNRAPITGVLEVTSARGSSYYRIDSPRPGNGGPALKSST